MKISIFIKDLVKGSNIAITYIIIGIGLIIFFFQLGQMDSSESESYDVVKAIFGVIYFSIKSPSLCQ